MEHFVIVQALCRAALASPTPAVRRQVERLREALEAAGAAEQEAVIARLLASGERTAEMVPSRLVRSSATVTGEALTPRTSMPVDKETAQPLAEVVFAHDLPIEPPLLSRGMLGSVTALLEEWQQIARLEALGIPTAPSCLIYGAPGTGKTQLALWMAGQLDLPVIVARLDGLISSLLGTTARNIATLFTFAARYRCVLLLDEFDAIAKLRDDPQEVGEIKRVVNAVLQNLDARRAQGLTIGITNHEMLLDPAIWRRFDVQLEMPRPELEARRRIALRYLANAPHREVLAGMIAWLTAGGSGAEIETVATSLRKRLALSDPGLSPYQAVLSVLGLHAGRVAAEPRAQLDHPPEDLARTLWQDQSLGFDQADLATVFGKDPATISRWVNVARRPRSRRERAT